MKTKEEKKGKKWKEKKPFWKWKWKYEKRRKKCIRRSGCGSAVGCGFGKEEKKNRINKIE